MTIGVAALALLALQAREALPLPGTREGRVLDLVRAFEREQRDIFWYRRARFEREQPPAGDGPVFRMRTFADCGNGLCAPDVEATRALGRELFAIYGFEAASGSEGPTVRLDGVDLGRRVGFEIERGELWPEDVQGDLSIEDLTALERDGYRVHVADLSRHVSTEGDVFTPTLAYLAGLVEFLNAVTGGEDVELGGLLFEREAQLAWPQGPALVLGPAVRLESERMDLFGDMGSVRALTLALAEPGFVRASFDGAPGFEPPQVWGRDDADACARRMLTGSTAGAPSVLAFSVVALVGGGGQRVERVRLVQERAGAEPLVHEASALHLFLPGEFDLARPFVLELELAPGRYRLNPGLRVGAAASR